MNASASGFATADRAQLSWLEAMVGQQVLYRAQHIRPVLTVLCTLLCLQKGQLMAQIGNTTRTT